MPFIVQTAAAHMPTNVRSPYRRIAVIEVEPGFERVAMISNRARGVVRIVEKWERLHAEGVNTAYTRALKEADLLAAKLNGGAS